MRYLLKINLVAFLSLTLLAMSGKAQDEIPPLGERLEGHAEALMEMSNIGQVYQSTDLLNYNVSYDFADSATISTILEHKEGRSKLYDNLFWGMIDSSMEYLQGQQYYVVVDHDSKNIYVYNKLNYSRVINVPLLDSLFNEVSVRDLILTRPGGIYKKLTIQYMPDMQYKQIEMVYDSTNYLIKSIAYYYNTTYYDKAYYNCQDMATALTVPLTGIPMPSSVTAANLIRTYKNFIAEFPGHTNGARVRMYVPTAYSLNDKNKVENGLPVLARKANTSFKGGVAAAAQTFSFPKNAFVNADFFTNAQTFGIDSIVPPAPKMMLKAAYASGSWVDSTMNAMQLFEWYMNEHLDVKYTAEVYTDWLVNTCGYKLVQLPWSETVAVSQDTLQNIWNRFATKYPASQLTISETVNVPIVKGVGTNSMLGVDTYDDEYLSAMTWTDGSWYIRRVSNVYDLSVLPRGLTIQAAYVSLYAFNPGYMFASHFRNSSQYPYLQVVPLKGLCIPGKSTFNQQPEYNSVLPVKSFASLSTDQVSSGNSSDFWSNQNYLNQYIPDLISAMFNNMQSTGINYPVQYKLNDESYVYKCFEFGGIACSNVAKRPTLQVVCSAPRNEVFAAFVNRALGTYLTYDQIKDIYKYSGKLDINGDCTAVTAGQGCDGIIGKSITGVTTISFTKVEEPDFDPNIFGESRFFYKIGENYYPQNTYAGYSVVPVLDENKQQ